MWRVACFKQPKAAAWDAVLEELAWAATPVAAVRLWADKARLKAGCDVTLVDTAGNELQLRVKVRMVYDVEYPEGV